MKRRGDAIQPRDSKSKQSRLEDCKSVVVQPYSVVTFTRADVLRLKTVLEEEDDDASLLDALRRLSCVLVSLADLRETLIGRAASSLKQHPNEEARRRCSPRRPTPLRATTIVHFKSTIHKYLKSRKRSARLLRSLL